MGAEEGRVKRNEIMHIEAEAKRHNALVQGIRGEIEKVIVGQRRLIDALLVALFANGHVLIEGVPGLAKTTAIKTLSKTLHASFQRIQFTPDLLPADVVGTLVYNAKEGCFSIRKGPIFANIVLADEINRAPAKVQSALLEAMEERQVTIGDTTFALEPLFMVMATQNPIEQEGTYPLPEAQLDRFMFKVNITYPSLEEEQEVLKRRGRIAATQDAAAVAGPEAVLKARALVDEIYTDEKIEKYVLDLVFATREPGRYGLDGLGSLIHYGASPRASIYLTVAARAYAFIHGRGYVTPQDVKSVAPEVLRHRVLVTYEAEAEGVTSDEIIRRILEGVEVP